MKDIKDDTNKWRNTPCSWMGKNDIMKTTILLKAISDSVQFLSNYQQHSSQNQGKNFTSLQFVWKYKRP